MEILDIIVDSEKEFENVEVIIDTNFDKWFYQINEDQPFMVEYTNSAKFTFLKSGIHTLKIHASANGIEKSDTKTFEVMDLSVFEECNDSYHIPKVQRNIWRSKPIKVKSSYFNAKGLSVVSKPILVHKKENINSIQNIDSQTIKIKQKQSQKIVSRILISDVERNIKVNTDNRKLISVFNKKIANEQMSSHTIGVNVIDTQKERYIPNNNTKLSSVVVCNQTISILSTHLSGKITLPIVAYQKTRFVSGFNSKAIQIVSFDKTEYFKTKNYYKFLSINTTISNNETKNIVKIIRVGDSSSFKNIVSKSNVCSFRVKSNYNKKHGLQCDTKRIIVNSITDVIKQT